MATLRMARQRKPAFFAEPKQRHEVTPWVNQRDTNNAQQGQNQKRGRPFWEVCLNVKDAALLFDNTFGGIAVVQGNAEGVDTCGKVVDVDNIAVMECGDDSSALVIDFYLIHFGWSDGESARGGVGVDNNIFKTFNI